MKQLPQPLEQKLAARQEQNALRKLPLANQLIDFASNDYLGFAKSEAIFTAAHQYLVSHNCIINGATGSRLHSGNHTL